MGSGLAHDLTRSQHEVTVVDNDPAVFTRLGQDFKGLVLLGNALDQDTFTRAGVAKADGLAAVTGNDAINIVVARAARLMFRVPKVIARTHDPRYTEIYHKLGIQTVTNVSLGIERISELLTFSPMDIIRSIGNGEVGIVRYEIPPLLYNHAVRDLSVPGEIMVISLIRNGFASIPTSRTTFQKGDIVYIALEERSAERLKTLMRVTGGG